jgi:hypothetical protein
MISPAQGDAPGHVFISYAEGDGARFAQRLTADLERAGVRTWVDKKQLRAGRQFPEQLLEAVATARAVLVVLTPGAVVSPYVNGEWNAALARYTFIVPLLVEDCHIPVGLTATQHLDFRTEYDTSLRRLLALLDEIEEHHLPYLRETLKVEWRNRRSAGNRTAFDGKIASLRAKIRAYSAALRHRGGRKDVGAEEPLAPSVSSRATMRRCRRSGEAPLSGFELFHDRLTERREMLRLLTQDDCRMLSVLGRGGMGKTALALNVLQQVAADDAGAVDGVALLSGRTGEGLNLGSVFLRAADLLDETAADDVRRAWAETKLTLDEKLERLLDALTSRTTVFLLDNFEDVLDDEGTIQSDGLRRFVELVLRRTHSPTLLVTSRVPVTLEPALARHDHRIELERGLPVSDAVALLRNLDPHGERGLRRQSDERLGAFAQRLHCAPRALEVAASILQMDRTLSLDKLQESFLLHQDVIRTVVEEHYRRIDGPSRRVLEAAAVMRRPVRTETIEFLLEGVVDRSVVNRTVSRLTASHALSFDRDAGLVTLHPIDSEYAYSRLPAAGEYTRAGLERRAAAWYRQQRIAKVPAGSTILHDVEYHLLEFHHLHNAGAYDEAMEVLSGIDNMLSWSGYASRVREMLDSLAGKLATGRGRMLHAIARAENHFVFGTLDQGRREIEAALSIARELADAPAEARASYVHAGIENQAGNADLAILLYRRALPLFRTLNDVENERYCMFDVALLAAGRRNAAELAHWKAEMQAFAAARDDSIARSLVATMDTLERLVVCDWHGALASIEALFEFYRSLRQENWFPALFNMQGLAAAGLDDLDSAAGKFRRAYLDALTDHNYQYAARAAFNRAWTEFKQGAPRAVLTTAHECAQLSRQMKEMVALDALVRAIRCQEAGDRAGAAQSLLQCAIAASRNIDLCDAREMATAALVAAQECGADEIARAAAAFLVQAAQESTVLPSSEAGTA